MIHYIPTYALKSVECKILYQSSNHYVGIHIDYHQNFRLWRVVTVSEEWWIHFFLWNRQNRSLGHDSSLSFPINDTFLWCGDSSLFQIVTRTLCNSECSDISPAWSCSRFCAVSVKYMCSNGKSYFLIGSPMTCHTTPSFRIPFCSLFTNVGLSRSILDD
jgi:hypothetical protein